MTTAKPIDASALATRILTFAADPASGMMPAQTRILRALATRLADITHVSPSGLVVAWGAAQTQIIRQDIDAGARGDSLATAVRAATLRELVAAVCDEDFAQAVEGAQ
jgi:hypothetical protein